MSQGFSQVPEPQTVAYPIVKFSHNTSPYGAKSFTWNHINYRNDLDFVLQNIRVADDRGNERVTVVMKITGGSEVLETQDIGELVTFCRGHDPSSGVDYPVELVVKSPFLAMRYPKTVHTVRRVQVKFRNESEFSLAWNTLKDFGLHVKDMGTTSNPTSSISGSSPSPALFRPISVSSASSASTSHTLSNSFSRPLSAVALPTPTREDRTPGIMPSHLGNHEFKMPSQQQEALTRSLYNSTLPRDQRAYSVTLPSTTSIEPLSLMKSGSFQQRPLEASSLYLSQLEKESESRSQPVSLSQINTPSQPASISQPPDDISAPSNQSIFLKQLRSQDDKISELLEARSRLMSASQSASHFFPPKPSSFGHSPHDPFIHTEPQRPHSASAEFSEPFHLSIPPRRELPFARPGEGSRSASVSALGPLPKPTPLQRTGLYSIKGTPATEIVTPAAMPQQKKRVAQRKAPVSKAAAKDDTTCSPRTSEKAAAADLSSKGEQLSQVSPLAAGSAAARPASTGLVSKVSAPPRKRAPPTRPASAASGLPLDAPGVPKKRAAPLRKQTPAKKSKMVDQGTQTKPVSSETKPTPIAQQVGSTNNVPTLTASTSSSSPGLPSPTPPQQYWDQLNAFITRHKARPPPMELWEAPEYAEADEEQRLALLNEFICENLENADFIELCQDTEKTWRRIGLSM